MSRKNTFLVLLFAASLAGCGGGDSDTATNEPPPETPAGTETGVFVDSAVGGLGYRTDTQEGETNADGEFEYVDGETVTFFIGDVELPAVKAGAVITPMDVFDTLDLTDQRVVNLARLLQSFDEDGDPSNGISIADAAHLAATGLSIDFDVPTADFEANTDVINLVSNGGGAGTLVSADGALAHLQNLSITGSWYVVNEEETIVVTVMRDGTYVFVEGTDADPADPTGSPGIEYGGWGWDPVSKKITAVVEEDTTGTWGLSEFNGDETVVREGSTLVYENPDVPEDGLTLTLAKDDANPLIGGWELKLPEEEKVIVITFNATHYAHGELGPSDEVGSSGPEFGTYTWDSATGAFNPVATVNHNGEWGFSHEPAAITAIVDGDTLTFTFAGEEGATVLARVK